MIEIKLTKEVKDLYSKHCKTLKNEWKEIHTWESIQHVHELGELKLLEFSYYPMKPVDSMNFLLKCQWHSDVEKCF